MSDPNSTPSGEASDSENKSTAEAGAAGEDDFWTNQQIVDPDVAQRAADTGKGADGE